MLLLFRLVVTICMMQKGGQDLLECPFCGQYSKRDKSGYIRHMHLSEHMPFKLLPDGTCQNLRPDVVTVLKEF